MIATVTCNPALDILVRPRRFSPGEINRYGAGMCQPGGKGINVSLLLHSLGVETKALALAGGFTGREIARLLEKRGCPGDFVWLPQGDSRINLKICPPGGGETQLNGEGPQIPEEAVERLERKLSALGPGDGAVLAGSLPASLPQDLYARLMKPLVKNGVEVAVDTTGEALLAALPCRPFPAEGTGDGFSPVITTIRRALQNSFLFCQNFSNRKGTGSARYCRSTRMGCACPSVSSVSAASNPSVHAAGV